jgi:hypothetical protein
MEWLRAALEVSQLAAERGIGSGSASASLRMLAGVVSPGTSSLSRRSGVSDSSADSPKPEVAANHRHARHLLKTAPHFVFKPSQGCNTSSNLVGSVINSTGYEALWKQNLAVRRRWVGFRSLENGGVT